LKGHEVAAGVVAAPAAHIVVVKDGKHHLSDRPGPCPTRRKVLRKAFSEQQCNVIRRVVKGATAQRREHKSLLPVRVRHLEDGKDLAFQALCGSLVETQRAVGAAHQRRARVRGARNDRHLERGVKSISLALWTPGHSFAAVSLLAHRAIVAATPLHAPKHADRWRIQHAICGNRVVLARLREGTEERCAPVNILLLRTAALPPSAPW